MFSWRNNQCITYFVLFLHLFFSLAVQAESKDDVHEGKASFSSTALLTVKNISLDKKIIHTEKGEVAILAYTLSQDAAVTVRFFNSSDELIRTVFKKKQQNMGSHSVRWDGKDDLGRVVHADYYVYTIEAVGHDAAKFVYDPSEDSGGKLLKSRNLALDKKQGTISYTLPRAGVVRIRAGAEGGPLLNTLVDWGSQEAGKHTLQWDGMDKCGLINLYELPKLEVYIFTYSLPDNSVIVRGEGERITGPPPSIQVGTRKVRNSSKNRETLYEHARHSRHICHEPSFSVQFPGDIAHSTENVPVVQGTVPVKITINEADRHHLETERFEVMFYLDTTFLFEDEEGFTPFTYLWDTSDIPEGEHIFTVNILSYDDHCGVESRKVIVRK